MGFGPYVAVHDPGELPVSEVKLYKTEMSAGNPVAPPTLFQWDSCFRFTGTRGHASEQIRIFLGVIQLICFRHDAGRLFLTASKFHELNIFAADVAQMCTFQETSGNSWTRTLVLCIPLKLWPHHPPPIVHSISWQLPWATLWNMKELSWFPWQQELGLCIVLCSVTECTDPHMVLPPPVTRQYLFSDHPSLSSFYPLSQLFPFSTFALSYFFLFAFSIPFLLSLSFSPSIIDSPPTPSIPPCTVTLQPGDKLL